jgi:hypothetical protein
MASIPGNGKVICSTTLPPGMKFSRITLRLRPFSWRIVQYFTSLLTVL